MPTAREFRRIALALPRSTESAHQGRPDFRVDGKVFATLSPDGKLGHVRVPPALLATLAKRDAATFAGAGGWAKHGWMRIDLARVAQGELAALVAEAHALRASARKGTPAKRAAPARSAPKKSAGLTIAKLRKIALALPGTTEDHPWGDTVFKVKGKVFVFSGTGERGFGFSVKLPESGKAALALPFAEPTGYGLGKSGWVSLHPPPEVPLDVVREWVEESWRAVAPKTLASAHARGTGTDE